MEFSNITPSEYPDMKQYFPSSTCNPLNLFFFCFLFSNFKAKTTTFVIDSLLSWIFLTLNSFHMCSCQIKPGRRHKLSIWKAISNQRKLVSRNSHKLEIFDKEMRLIYLCNYMCCWSYCLVINHSLYWHVLSNNVCNRLMFWSVHVNKTIIYETDVLLTSQETYFEKQKKMLIPTIIFHMIYSCWGR